MASEELENNYHGLVGKRVGDCEMFSTQLTTVNQYVEHGLLPNKAYKNGNRKFDKLVVRRGGGLLNQLLLATIKHQEP